MSDEQKCQVSYVHEEVNKIIGNHNEQGTVRNMVIEHLVQEKLEKNKLSVLTGLNKLKEAKVELSKLERDGEKKYAMDGKVISESFTKQQLDEINKARQKVTKLENSLDDALNKGDYKKLEECCGK